MKQNILTGFILILLILSAISSFSSASEPSDIVYENAETGNAAGATDAAGETSMICITDAAPFPFEESADELMQYGIHITTYTMNELSAEDDISLSADFILTDLRSEENSEKIDILSASGNISGRRVSFVRNGNIFSASIDGGNDQQNTTAAKYWTRHPENMRSLLLYLAAEFDGRTDIPEAPETVIDLTDPANRTSILLVVTPNTGVLTTIMDEMADYGIDLEFPDRSALQYCANNMTAQAIVESHIRNYSGDIILEILYGNKFESAILETIAGKNMTAIISDGFNFNKTAYANVTVPENSQADVNAIKDMTAYWDCALPENMKRMFIKCAYEADGRKDLEQLVRPSITVPKILLYHPDAPVFDYNGDRLDHIFTNRTDYNDWYRNVYKPSAGLPDNGKWIAISSYFRDYQEGKMHTEDLMVRKLEAEGYNVIVISHQKVSVAEYFSTDPEKDMPVDLFISFQTFGYNQYLKEYDCPVLEAVTLSGYESLDEWEDDRNGLKKSSFYYKIDQSEAQGSLFPIGVEIQMTPEDPIPYPIEDRVDRLLGQAMNYAELRTTPNSEKKIALIYFNHPPGKQNVGASYLNLFGSIENILKALSDDGYSVTPYDEEEIEDLIMTGGRNVGGWAPGELEKLVDEGLEDGSVVLLPVSTYEAWISDMTDGEKQVIDNITAEWGEPGESDFMTVTRNGTRYFVFPVIFDGNIIMMPEPARGWDEDLEKLYHDMTIPTPHQYAAFYLWLQKPEEEGGFGADAMVHIGRHGTQEWLPGKEICMNETSAADFMVGDIPNIYIYIVDGSGEGLQAKRRGYAELISHLTPPIAQSGLNEELSGLNALLVSYDRASAGGNEQMVSEYREQITVLLAGSSVINYLGLTEEELRNCSDEEFSEIADDAASFLEIVNSQTIPYGTHIFGGTLSEEKSAMFIESIFYDRFFSMAADLLGYDVNTESYPEKAEIAGLVSDLALRAAQSDDFDSFERTIRENAVTYTVPDDLSQYRSVYESSVSLIDSLNGVYETQGLLDGLNGRYVPTSPQGDPVKNPDVLPTGRNYIGFVSNTVPTETSYRLGVRLADEMIASYYNETGAFPEKIGVVLWSVETFRHDGVMESMTLRLMGAEPFMNTNATTGKLTGTVNNTKVNITKEEDLTVMTKDGVILRPRIDPVITMSGLYRDTLPYQIRMIDKAVSTIASYDKDTQITNYVRLHSLSMYDELTELDEAGRQGIIDSYNKASAESGNGSVFEGEYEELAQQLSCIRLFGPPPESYGTGIEKEIGGGYNWTSEDACDTIGGLYIFRMANMYTVSSAGDIIYLGNFERVFSMNLADTPVITNSRSSSLYGILDNDDFFQYVGGMSVAIQSLSPEKKAPQTLIVNLRKEGKIETLSDFLKNEILSRPLNEKYQDGMIESGYSGMKELSEIVENLWGWQVTTPDAVGNYMWDDVFIAYVENEKVSSAFKESNPYAYQSVLARMIDAEFRGYWETDDETVQKLAAELAESVVQTGVACCHHTCGNPTLNDRISGLLSVPGVCEPDVASEWHELMETATGKTIRDPSQKTDGKSSGKSSGSGSAKIVIDIPDATKKPEENETYIPNTLQTDDKTDAGAGKDQNAEAGKQVSGYEMTEVKPDTPSSVVEDFLKNPTFSAMSAAVIILAAGIVALIYFGSRKKGF
ncbi:cobaltochelatase subunit CobN [Methanosarcinaceae archaeon]|nr:cobaltochelatase subunit CobN [Methanosarcinaceae archaeon]